MISVLVLAAVHLAATKSLPADLFPGITQEGIEPGTYLIPCHNSPSESTELEAAWTELHSPLSKGFAAGKPREGQSTLLLASAEIPISSLVVHYVPADCGPQSAISGCRSVLSR